MSLLSYLQILTTNFSVKGVLEDYKQFQNYVPEKSKENESDGLSDLSDDEEVFQQYREARMRELQNAHKTESSDLVEELNLETYVKVAESDGHGEFYLIRHALSGFSVVICIYKPNCQDSVMVLRNLEHIAAKNPHVKFARANGATVLEESSSLVRHRFLPFFKLYSSSEWACPVSLAISTVAKPRPSSGST